MPLQRSIPSRKTSNSRYAFLRIALRSIFATIILVSIVIATAVAEANEHEAAPAAEHGAPKEGEHGAAKEGPAKPKPICTYSEHESRLSGYLAKIRGLEKEIAEMIAAQHHTENSEKIKLLTQQIGFKYSDLRKVVKDYEEVRLHVRFQHPDRDMDGDRQYTAHRLKSLDEIETAFGLDGRLDRVRKQVGVVFPTAAPEQPKSARKPANAKPASDDDDDMPSGIHLVK